MNIDALSRVKTIDEIRGLADLVVASATEHEISPKKAFQITGSDLSNLTYNQSMTKNGYITRHWYTWGSGANVGLAYSVPGSTDVTVYADARYSNFACVHLDLWIARRFDAMFDIIYKGKSIVSEVKSTDLIGIGGILFFLQVDTVDYRSLICVDTNDLVNGIFFPTCIEDFVEWFTEKVRIYGYQGTLDCESVSNIFRVYYEVQNCIFSNRPFAPITP